MFLGNPFMVLLCFANLGVSMLIQTFRVIY